MGLFHSLFRYKAWANQETFAAVAQLSEPELHKAIRILNHIYVVDRIFQAHIQGIAHPYTNTNTAETPSLAELRENVQQTDAWFVDYTQALKTEDLAVDVIFTFTDGERGKMSLEEILAHVVTHGGYHRGAVGQILAQSKVTPPRDIYTKFLHQEEPLRRASLN